MLENSRPFGYQERNSLGHRNAFLWPQYGVISVLDRTDASHYGTDIIKMQQYDLRDMVFYYFVAFLIFVLQLGIVSSAVLS